MPSAYRALILACAALVLSGCIAQRTVSTLKAAPDAAAQLAGLRFRVLQVEPGMDYAAAQNLQAEMSAAYPSLFVDDPVAIPLVVRTAGRYEQHFAGAVLTGLTLGIIPWPVSYGHHFEFGVAPWSGRGAVLPEAVVRYAVMRHEWATMLTPLGLIPIPGRSDLPRRSAIIMDEAGMKAYETRRTAFAAEQRRRALVTALAGLDRDRLRAYQAEREALPALTVDIDGRRYQSRLLPSFSGHARQAGGADQYRMHMRTMDPASGKVTTHSLLVARRDPDGAWQVLRPYLLFASRPTIATVLLQDGVPARPVVMPVEHPPLADFLEGPSMDGHEVAWALRWSNGILLQIKNSSLAGELAGQSLPQLQELMTRLESTLLTLNERVGRANDRAQQAIEKGESPEASRELAVVYRQRSEILKAILLAVRQEAAARSAP